MNENNNEKGNIVQPTSVTPKGEPTEPVTTLPISKPEPKKRFRPSKKLLIIAGVVVLLLGGSSAGAYYGYYVPNKPNNVVYKAISNFISNSSQDRSFNFTDSTTNKSAGSGSPSTIAINGGVDASSNIRADAQVSYSVFKLTLSTIVRTNDKELYVKVNELPSLLKIYGSDMPGLNQLANKLDKNWLRLNVNDLKNAGFINDQQAKSADKCVNSLSDFITTRRSLLGSTIESAYKSNAFLNAHKIGSDTVDGAQATKYSLSVDKTKANNFFNQLNSILNTSANGLNKDCSSGPNNQSSDTKVQNTEISNFYLWVNSRKELVRLSATVGDKSSSSDITATFGNKKVDTAKPDNVLTLKDLQTEINQLFGSETVQGLYGGSFSI